MFSCSSVAHLSTDVLLLIGSTTKENVLSNQNAIAHLPFASMKSFMPYLALTHTDPLLCFCFNVDHVYDSCIAMHVGKPAVFSSILLPILQHKCSHAKFALNFACLHIFYGCKQLCTFTLIDVIQSITWQKQHSKRREFITTAWMNISQPGPTILLFYFTTTLIHLTYHKIFFWTWWKPPTALFFWHGYFS